MPKPTPPDCPVPNATGFCSPEGTGSNGVLILGESLGEAEAEDGLPFRPSAPAGSVLERAIRRAGFDRREFVLWNVVPVHPPKNWLEGAPWEAAACAWGLPMLEEVIRDYKPKVVLALGNVALRCASGVAGERRGVGNLRGYCLSSRLADACVGSFHPSFLRRGAMSLLSVLMHDIKLACLIAKLQPGQRGRFASPVLGRDFIYTRPTQLASLDAPPVPPGYVLHPTERDAWVFLEQARDAKLIAYDIETPRSAVTTEDDTDELAEVDILSIQFSLAPGTGIFMPWREPFIDVARRVLALPNAKAGCNNWRFDDPLLVAHGCPPAGHRHDVRWAWHHLQPDMKASLQFVASFYQEPDFNFPWKHLHDVNGPLYGILDVDAVQRICQ